MRWRFEVYLDSRRLDEDDLAFAEVEGCTDRARRLWRAADLEAAGSGYRGLQGLLLTASLMQRRSFGDNTIAMSQIAIRRNRGILFSCQSSDDAERA